MELTLAHTIPIQRCRAIQQRINTALNLRRLIMDKRPEDPRPQNTPPSIPLARRCAPPTAEDAGEPQIRRLHGSRRRRTGANQNWRCGGHGYGHLTDNDIVEKSAYGASRFHGGAAGMVRNSDGSGDRSELHSGHPAPAATNRPPRATNGGEATAATPTPTANPELPSQQSGSQIIQLSGTGTNRQVYRGRESAVRRITDPTQAARWLSRIPGITDGCCRSSRWVRWGRKGWPRWPTSQRPEVSGVRLPVAVKWPHHQRNRARQSGWDAADSWGRGVGVRKRAATSLCCWAARVWKEERNGLGWRKWKWVEEESEPRTQGEPFLFIYLFSDSYFKFKSNFKFEFQTFFLIHK
jgi:hypothetical protein